MWKFLRSSWKESCMTAVRTPPEISHSAQIQILAGFSDPHPFYLWTRFSTRKKQAMTGSTEALQSVPLLCGNLGWSGALSMLSMLFSGTHPTYGIRSHLQFIQETLIGLILQTLIDFISPMLTDLVPPSLSKSARTDLIPPACPDRIPSTPTNIIPVTRNDIPPTRPYLISPIVTDLIPPTPPNLIPPTRPDLI